jgi:hypothetical protein
MPCTEWRSAISADLLPKIEETPKLTVWGWISNLAETPKLEFCGSKKSGERTVLSDRAPEI